MSSPEHTGADTGPAEKTKKYDRQLRLWGDHGQAALEKAKVCLINATATGTEILKNLILPGVGSFTVVDNHTIKGDDVGNNFFLDKDSIGKSRAQMATEMLLELNEDVNGDFVDESVDNLIDGNQEFFSNFTIVIVSELNEKTLMRLGSILWEYGVPMLICRSYGFIGYMRLVIREHTVIESHPDSAHEDLRLDKSFPEFEAFCDSIDLDSLSKKDHSHTPWLVLIYKYLKQWKKEHDGAGPKNYKEKQQFKEYIRAGIRKNAEGVPVDEENFDEAIRNVNTSLVPTSIPSQVQDIFNDSRCTQLNSESCAFWILSRAVKEFVDNEGKGCLPLRGSIPDMTSDSERYITLQNVYKQQADSDVADVTKHVYELLQNIGKEQLMRSPVNFRERTQDCIRESDVRLFCKNASFLRFVRCSSLEEEYTSSNPKLADLAMYLENDEDSELVFYVMLRAIDRFYSEFNHYPGIYEGSVEADIPKLKSCLTKLLQEWNMSQVIKDEFVHEFCRYGACELHSVAAFMGGAAAQEVIKIITRQFVPINNTYIYNAMKQTSTCWQL